MNDRILRTIMHIMKAKSLKLKLVLIGVAAIVAVGAISVGYAIAMFRAEIGRLYSEDYSERIRNMEFEYQDVEAGIARDRQAGDDAVTAVTSATRNGGGAVNGYRADDAVTAVTSATRNGDGTVWGSEYGGGLQGPLLERLNNRFIAGRELRGQPFIFNGDRNMTLFLDRDGLSAPIVLDAIFDSVVGEPHGELEVTLAGTPYWVAFSYYEPWDWYTGYVLPDSVRFAGLAEFSRNIGLVILAVIALFVFIYLRFLSRTLRPFSAIPVAMQRFLEGDVNQQLAVKGRDEVGRISQSFNDFVGSLREILTVMRSACDENTRIENELNDQAAGATRRMRAISDSTTAMKDRILDLNGKIENSSASVQRIGSQVQSLSRSIDDQMSAVTQSTAAIEQMSASLDSVASITAVKKQSSIDLTRRAQEGSDQLAEMQESIQAVSGSVDDIAGFVDIIKNIASQTNLLSMNAAIEAAHAGESGKGFAVVADEIRKLAAEAGQSSNSIAAVITTIIDRIRTAAALSSETGGVFEAIEKEVHAVSDSFQEIAAATDQLASGSAEIREAMSMLNEISSTVKQGSEESIAASADIVEAMRSVIEISAQLMSEISEIDAGTGQGAGDLDQISVTAGALSESVAALQRIMDRFRVNGAAAVSGQQAGTVTAAGTVEDVADTVESYLEVEETGVTSG